MKLRPGGLPAVILLAVLLAPGLAAGGGAAIPAGVAAEARAAFEEGRRLYRTSRYDPALERFLRAYKLDPRPAFLFNIARCHEVQGQLDRAIEHYEMYLARLPGAENRALVVERLAALRQRQARKEEAGGPARGKEPAMAAAGETLATAPDAVPTSGRGWRWYMGWAGVGVGAGLVITGGVMSALASQKADAFNEGVASGMTYGDLSEIESSGQALQAAQIGTLAAGGVVLVAGAALLTWFLLDGGDRREAAAAGLILGPHVSSQGGGLVLGGTF